MTKELYISDTFQVELYLENKLSHGFKNRFWIFDIIPSLYLTLDKQAKSFPNCDAWHSVSIGFSWTIFTIDLEFTWKVK